MLKPHLICVIVALTIVFTSSCESEEDPIPLIANAGDLQTVAPLITVTLDGSASTGPENFQYQWSFISGPVSENEISFNDKTLATATFIPPKNGSYSFKLTITHNGSFNEAQVGVNVTGAITLPAAVSETFFLQDIEPDPSKPDYIATGPIVVTAGNFGMKETNGNFGSGVQIEFQEAAGIVVQGGSVNLTNTTLTGASGWKGILINGGTLVLKTAMVNKAGKSTHEGQNETASITYVSGNLVLEQTTFTGSQGIHDLVITKETAIENISFNTFATARPVKSPVQHVTKLIGNTVPANFEYIVLTTPGAGTIVTSPYGEGFQFYSRYLIDGDITVGSPVVFNGNSKIFMKAGSGFFQSSASLSTSGGEVVIQGEEDSSWKGIAIGPAASINVTKLEIINAGSDLFNTGAFSSSVKASIYFASNNNSMIAQSIITGSGGYGVYQDAPSFYVPVTSTVFSNTAAPAISLLVSNVHNAIHSSNTYTMPEGVAAVEVRSPNPNLYKALGIWPSLGATNFYLSTGSLASNDSWTLSAGVNIKFKSGKSLMIFGGQFNAIGTAENPITFDSEAGTPGTWAGMIIQSPYKMEYCQVKNGGETMLFRDGLSPATALANIVFNYNGTLTTNSFKNNTVSGSLGHGILVEAGTQNPDAENVAYGNTFSDNQLADVAIK